ncbi:lasso peptide biosynthesis PqqD family chaperone [Actinosynnema sp. NPDC023587]|uniref:lasso peptide biosynthesis PqqD family chaperone n=1 Tax=Actinosynnema sp. NPDC023587 TaxID=3154695 RepID=UPI0033DA98C9
MTFTLARHVSVTDTDSGMVLLDQKSGRYWQLNGTAAAVVRGLVERTRPEDVVRALSLAHPEQAGRVASDVAAFLGSLREAKLVTS